MKTRQTRILGAALLVASLGALALTLPQMVERLREHNRATGASLFKIEPALDPEFSFRGEPVRVEDVRNGDARSLTVHYRGDSFSIALDGAVDDRLPGLVKYESFLRFFSIASARPVEREEAVAYEQQPWRLFVAARHTPPGENPETWGAVERKKWQYEIYELLPAGAAAPEPLPEPSGTLVNAYGKLASVTPVSGFESSEAWARWTFNMSALPDYERTIQYAAAIEVTPPLHRPRNVFTDTGLNALDWTWPAAGTAILGAMVGGLILASSFARRRFGDERKAAKAV